MPCLKFRRSAAFPRLFATLALLASLTGVSRAVNPGEGDPPPPTAPEIAPASAEGEQAIGSFRIPEGMELSLFAAEPLVANPVAICLDEMGRVYVAETFRQGRGVEDNRHHGAWLDDDLAAQTVEDRLAYYRKHLKEKIVDYTKHDDRITRLEDRDGDGQADHRTVFADRFNGVLEGSGAGLLARRGSLYYTCIPNLWMLPDANDDGVADERKSLHTGYGVRVAFRGHDMHGLCIGPDGRLYYSIGDRGYHVKTADGRTLADPESGAVFRCDLDGGNLEVFATGLRNPQELAFDDFGNLFTGDNNSDSGDKARWVYICEGADIGWRMAYQYLSDRGPWNREQLWHPYHAGQAAYIVPPVANLGDGPSGLTYYPGTGMGDALRGHFFLCDFRGGPARSGIRSFRMEPAGAGFTLADSQEFVWNLLATDADFGPDGALYISDWVNGWNGLGKGRIYRLTHSAHQADALVKETRTLLAADLTKRSVAELVPLLAHADRRVRQEAQFALVAAQAVQPLTAVARENPSQLARLHAMWGLEMIARQQETPAALALLPELLGDADAEVRAHAARLCGEAKLRDARPALEKLLADSNLRVRYFAALSLGKLQDPAALAPLVEMLAANNDVDPVLRHAGIMGLAGVANAGELIAAAGHPSPAVRVAIAVALRRQQSPAVARLLPDADPRVVLEAARAIHDTPIPSAMPALAAMLARPTEDDALLRRMLNANNRMGDAASAERVAALAANDRAPEAMRLEALDMLATWDEPAPRDRVLGMWRPIAKRDRGIAVAALEPALPGIFTASDKVRERGANVAARLGIQNVGPALVGLVKDEERAGRVRGAALAALTRLKNPAALEMTSLALMSSDATLRSAGRAALAQLRPGDAVMHLEQAVNTGELIERQQALVVLATLPGDEAKVAMVRIVDKLVKGDIPADTRLDVVEAAQQRKSPQILQRLERYYGPQAHSNPLTKWRDSLRGGSAERGREIFHFRSEVSCVRCHTADGPGGQVGPKLAGVGIDKTREYLLESIVAPSGKIAKGFETVVLLTDDGRIQTGVLREETADHLRLITPAGQILTIAKETIEERRTGESAMPADLVKHLTPRDVRDLVEYLASLKTKPAESE